MAGVAVILITTKSASNNEKASVTFEAYAGVQTRWRKLDLMQSQEHLETMFKINGASQAELEAYQTGGYENSKECLPDLPDGCERGGV